MEHLVSFNENKFNVLCKSLYDIADSSLAYLKDEGFSFSIDPLYFEDNKEFIIYLESSKDVIFKDILPDVIPFLELISSKVDIVRINVTVGNLQYDLTIRELEVFSTMDNTYERNFEVPRDIIFSIFSRAKKVSTLTRIKKFFKSFNESKLDSLEDFCNTNLAYLLDEGYELSFEGIDSNVEYKNGNFTQVEQSYTMVSLSIESEVSTEEEYDAGEYEWNEINDDFIPFLEILNANYTIEDEIEFFTNKGGLNFIYYTVDELIADKPLELDCQIYQIKMKVS